MEAPFYPVVSADSGVQALLGSGSSIRLYPAEAPHNVQSPYAIFSSIYATPENDLDAGAGADTYALQIDCYSKDYDQAVSVAGAIRTAIEPHAIVTSLRGVSRDPVTRLFNYQFDIEWMTTR